MIYWDCMCLRSTGIKCSLNFEPDRKYGDIFYCVFSAYDSSAPRHRTAFSQHQLAVLEEEFQTCKYVERSRSEELSEQLDIPKPTIFIWFQNRRRKYRKEIECGEIG
ncbi:hypothetical protein SNE40_023322 [Patella caerulea]|uniref:Homeobox domain-containing protein n=1 Tax=Patella caerulea TaxID=87958 RepID=A0AAN8G9Y3_PATCE